MTNSQKTLVILAAGMASRYGKGAKQVESFGPSGETIMEYSIFDAIDAGFDKVLFIIREDFAESFKANLEPKLKGKIDTDYVYQQKESFIGDHTIPQDRVKPFGTAHALLCCKGKIDGPFAVINADDYYGSEAFQIASKFLTDNSKENHYACIGYHLENTLSDNGSVTRGEIFVDKKGNVNKILERKKIEKGSKGEALYLAETGNKEELPLDTKVSMNFFCFNEKYVDWLEKEYQLFLDENISDIKSEFLIPEITDKLIHSGIGTVEMIPTKAQWFGVTYKEDAPDVKSKFHELAEEGVYPQSLWA